MLFIWKVAICTFNLSIEYAYICECMCVCTHAHTKDCYGSFKIFSRKYFFNLKFCTDEIAFQIQRRLWILQKKWNFFPSNITPVTLFCYHTFLWTKCCLFSLTAVWGREIKSHSWVDREVDEKTFRKRKNNRDLAHIQALPSFQCIF